MTEDPESEDEGLEVEFEEAAPRAVVFDVPDGQIMIPDIDALAEVLGEVPAALWATDKGLFFLSPARRWESVEVAKTAAVASIRKN